MRGWTSCFLRVALALGAATVASSAAAQDGFGFGNRGFDQGQFDINGDRLSPTPLEAENIERDLDQVLDPADLESLLSTQHGILRSGQDLTSGAMLPTNEFQNWILTLGPDMGWSTFVEPGIEVVPRENPISDPISAWRLLEILPHLMPVGPDGTSPVMPVGPDGISPVVPGLPSTGISVTPVPAGGSILRLSNPNVLDWNGGLKGDTSCFKPQVVDPARVGNKVNAVRMLTALVAGSPGVLRPVGDQIAARRLEKCSPGVASVHTRHCTGLLEPPEGQAIWTAAHCLLNPSSGLAEASLRDIGVGESRPCSSETAFRAVSLLGLTRDDFIIPENFIRPCKNVERVADDIVRVALATPLPVVPADGKVVEAWRLPESGEMEKLLVEGRRLYGTGFMQSAVLYDLMGGRAMPMEDCLVALAGRLNLVGDGPTPAGAPGLARLRAEIPDGAMIHQGYGCTSMDTMNGSSGGPVFAMDDYGSSLVLVGFISAASWTSFDMECSTNTEGKSVLQDECGVEPEIEGGLNLFAVLPVPTPWGGN